MGSKLPARIYAVTALLALTPLELARWHYGRALAADIADAAGEAETHLADAVRLDPLFPLYPMRLALLRAREPGQEAAASGLASRAARESGAVPPLWLVAGILGRSAPSLERACVLDPLNPFAPFYQMLSGREGPDAPAYGAQALLSEPSLAAAVFWERRPDLQHRALEVLRAWPGVDAGWKEALLKAVPPPGERQGPVSRVALLIDTEERESLSLPVFRRRPWPTQWGLIQVRRSTLARVQLPPAAASKGTSDGFFHSAPCLRRSTRGQSLLIR